MIILGDIIMSKEQSVNIELNQNDRTRCEVYSRVMGYHRPVEYWNKGKQAEYAERVNFKLPKNF